MKLFIAGIIIGLAFGVTVSTFAQSASSTKDIFIEPIFIEPISAEVALIEVKAVLFDRDNLLSKYAKLYDSCKNF